MNIIIYTVVILTLFYLLLRFITNISSKKLSKGLRILIVIGLIVLAILFAIAGRYILTLPLTLASLALLKLKGLSLFQLISLFRLIQTLRRSGRFSFNQSQSNNTSTMSVNEAFKILNLDEKKKITIEMTLTSPNCPVAESLPNSVKDNILKLDGVNDVKMKLVWDPPWTKEKMSEAAKLELNL